MEKYVWRAFQRTLVLPGNAFSPHTAVRPGHDSTKIPSELDMLPTLGNALKSEALSNIVHGFSTFFRQGATAGHLIAHLLVHSGSLLAKAEKGKEEGAADVVHNVVLNAHDFLDLLAPVDHEAARAQICCEDGAAQVGNGSLPEATDASSCIGMGHAHQGAAETMNAHPLVLKAAADAIVEVIVASILDVLVGQRALALDHGIDSTPVVHDSEDEHDDGLTPNSATPSKG